MLNNNQQQKFPNSFANKFSRELYNFNSGKQFNNMKQSLIFKTDSNDQSIPFANCPPVPPPEIITR